MQGTNMSKYIQPLRPVSWSRRIATAILGMSTARPYRLLSNPALRSLENRPKAPSMICRTIEISTLNSTNSQYSFRRDLPEKSAYFFNASRYQFMGTSFQGNEHRKNDTAGRHRSRAL